MKVSFTLTLLLTTMKMLTKTTGILPSQTPEYSRDPYFSIVINTQDLPGKRKVKIELRKTNKQKTLFWEWQQNCSSKGKWYLLYCLIKIRQCGDSLKLFWKLPEEHIHSTTFKDTKKYYVYVLREKWASLDLENSLEIW